MRPTSSWSISATSIGRTARISLPLPHKSCVASWLIAPDGGWQTSAPARLDRVDILTLDRALEQLQELDPDQARIVELRFFGDLTVEETAIVMRSSPATVKREW